MRWHNSISCQFCDASPSHNGKNRFANLSLRYDWQRRYPDLGEKPKIDLGMTAFEDLFKDANELAEQKLPRIYDIPIVLMDDFPNHPFRVRQDEDMELLVASIKERGLITPVTLRPKRNGRYEMVSGHRRNEACRQLGLTTIKADVRDMTCDEATIIMVESNLQRTVILACEFSDLFY